MTEQTIKELCKQGIDTIKDLELLTIVEPIKSEVLKIEKEFGSFGDTPSDEGTKRLLNVVKNSQHIKLSISKRKVRDAINKISKIIDFEQDVEYWEQIKDIDLEINEIKKELGLCDEKENQKETEQ